MKDNVILEKLFKLGKWILIVLILILCVLTIGLSKMYSNDTTTKKEETNNTEYNTEYDVSMFKEISASDIKTETKDKLSLIYIGRSSCSWCAAFLPTLQKAQSEFDYTTLYIDISKIIDFENGGVTDQSAYDLLTGLKGDGYEDYMSKNFGSTPMMLVIKNSKIISAKSGYSEYEEFKTFIEEAGL